MNLNNSRLWKIFSLLFAGLLFAGTVIWTAQTSKPAAYRDPAGVSPMTTEYVYTMSPDGHLYHPGFKDFLSSINVRTNASEISITMPGNQSYNEYFENSLFEYHTIEPGAAFESAEGRIWIEHIAVAYGEFPEDSLNAPSVRLPARYFGKDFQELAGEVANKIITFQPDRSLRFQGAFPAVTIALKGELNVEAEVVKFRAFDSRMHHLISSDSGWAGALGYIFETNMEIRLWHSAPVEYVVDVAFGPPEIIERPLKVGELIELPEGMLMLLLKGTNLNGPSYTSGIDRVTASMQIVADSADGPTANLLFATFPNAQVMPMKLEFLDGEGKAIEQRVRSSSGLLMAEELQAKVEDIQTIRIIRFPNRKRLVFRLSEIPGLPEANQDIENLFDVRVPYLRVRDNSELRSLIGTLTQLGVAGKVVPDTPSTGPVILRNVTVKELVDQYAKLIGPTYGVEIDQENLTIEFLDMSLRARAERAWEDFKSKFR